MSEDRHQLIRDAFASWNAGEREFNPERTHPDFILHSVLTSADFHGPEGFRRWTAEIDEQFERWSVSLDSLQDAPDGRVLVLGEIRFVGRSSGIESRQEAGWVFRFEGGRAIEMWNFADREAARREAGVENLTVETVEAALAGFPSDLVGVVRDDERWAEWVAAVGPAFHPDFELVRSEQVAGLLGGNRRRRGLEALREYWREFTEPYDAYREVPDEVIGLEDDRVLVVGRAEATLAAGGATILQDGAVIIRVEDGLLREFTFFFGDRSAALREAGLEP